MITKNDGTNKNDSERKAAKRFFNDFRREHPHLKVIVVEDALSSNGPHITELEKHNLRFILGAKPGDHKSLFSELRQAADEGRASEVEFLDPENRTIGHFFRYLNNVPLNKSNPVLLALLNSLFNLIALLPFKNPTMLAILYFGGIFKHR